MPEKFPQYVFAGYSIFRKLVCFLLGITLITVQSGCYTYRTTRSVEKQQIVTEKIKYGDSVRIYYKEGSKIRYLQGQIIAKRVNEVTIQTEQTETKLPLDHIIRIDLLEKKFNLGGTIILGTSVSLGIVLLVRILTVGNNISLE